MVEILVYERGVGHFEHKFQGKGLPPTTVGVRKNRVPGLSRGVVCVSFRLAVLIQYRRVTHRQTDTHTQTDTRRLLIPAHS